MSMSMLYDHFVVYVVVGVVSVMTSGFCLIRVCSNHGSNTVISL